MMVAGTKIGSDVPLVVVRNGKELKISAVIAKLDSGEGKLAENGRPAHGKWGLQLQESAGQGVRRPSDELFMPHAANRIFGLLPYGCLAVFWRGIS